MEVETKTPMNSRTPPGSPDRRTHSTSAISFLKSAKSDQTAGFQEERHVLVNRNGYWLQLCAVHSRMTTTWGKMQPLKHHSVSSLIKNYTHRCKHCIFWISILFVGLTHSRNRFSLFTAVSSHWILMSTIKGLWRTS